MNSNVHVVPTLLEIYGDVTSYNDCYIPTMNVLYTMSYNTTKAHGTSLARVHCLPVSVA
jgi:hypothetical protein